MTMILRVFDVEHGACAMLQKEGGGALAMIDCGHNTTSGWRPSAYIRDELGLVNVAYLLITNADQGHISDLHTLLNSGVSIDNLMSNTLVRPEILYQIKQAGGPVSSDALALIGMQQNFGRPGVGNGPSFVQRMGGIEVSSFFHGYPQFTDTNNLSCVYFIKYNSFKILFPGDIERAGWEAHMQNPAFRAELQGTNILVASHHGRLNGYSETAFRNIEFDAVIISDKSIVHATQETVPDYRAVVRTEGVVVTDLPKRRHVLTTRRDGDIILRVENDSYSLKLTR